MDREREAISFMIQSFDNTPLVRRYSELDDLSPTEIVRVHEIASHILHGDVDRDELVGLSESARIALESAVERLVELQNSTEIFELQEVNPYYSVSAHQVVRDDALVTREDGAV